MALVQTITNITARPVLNNGTDSEGNMKTVNGSFGATLAMSDFMADDTVASQKLLNIAGALEDCLALEMRDITKTVTYSMANDE